MKRILLSCILLLGLCASVSAQNLNEELAAANARSVSVVASDIVEVADGDKFHRGVIVAAQELVKRGEMKRAELLKLRVAMLSPAFRQHAEDLAVIQMEASGVVTDEAPTNADGQIDRGSINWEGLAAFLEKLIPLILMLIKAFGGA